MGKCDFFHWVVVLAVESQTCNRAAANLRTVAEKEAPRENPDAVTGLVINVRLLIRWRETHELWWQIVPSRQGCAPRCEPCCSLFFRRVCGLDPRDRCERVAWVFRCFFGLFFSCLVRLRAACGHAQLQRRCMRWGDDLIGEREKRGLIESSKL